jgi:hypothetical protein
MKPTQERIAQCLRYRDGSLSWIKSQGSQLAGSRAGNSRPDGYVRIKIDGRLVMAHSLIWILHHGAIPDAHEIDHINGNPSDNRIESLRVATHAQNNCNMKLACHSTTGFKGVTKRKGYDKWRAYITMNKKRTWLGEFSDPLSAHAAYRDAAKRLFGDFARDA